MKKFEFLEKNGLKDASFTIRFIQIYESRFLKRRNFQISGVTFLKKFIMYIMVYVPI